MIAGLHERRHRRLAHLRLGIAQEAHECSHDALLLETSQRLHGRHADLRRLILDGGKQPGHRDGGRLRGKLLDRLLPRLRVFEFQLLKRPPVHGSP